MFFCVRNILNNQCYLSPSELLDLEQEMLREATYLLSDHIGETPEDPDASLITLIMPILRVQTEVLKNKKNLSNRALKVFWADRSLSTEERACFFQYRELLEDFITTINQGKNRISILKAAAKIGNREELQKVLSGISVSVKLGEEARAIRIISVFGSHTL